MNKQVKSTEIKDATSEKTVSQFESRCRTICQIPKKCKETSNLMWLPLIWFMIEWDNSNLWVNLTFGLTILIPFKVGLQQLLNIKWTKFQTSSFLFFFILFKLIFCKSKPQEQMCDLTQKCFWVFFFYNNLSIICLLRGIYDNKKHGT